MMRNNKAQNLSQKQIRYLLFEACGGICPDCGRKMQNNNPSDLKTYMTVDHIIPKCRGGRKNIENLRPLCKRCNSTRGDKRMNVMAFKDYKGNWIVV